MADEHQYLPSIAPGDPYKLIQDLVSELRSKTHDEWLVLDAEEKRKRRHDWGEDTPSANLIIHDEPVHPRLFEKWLRENGRPIGTNGKPEGTIADLLRFVQ